MRLSPRELDRRGSVGGEREQTRKKFEFSLGSMSNSLKNYSIKRGLQGVKTDLV